MSVAAAVLVAVGVYLTALGGLYTVQRSLIFFPDARRFQPHQLGLASVEEIVLESDQGQLFSWYLAAPEDRPTFLMFHGNAGSVASRAPLFDAFEANGLGLFVLGYPGYGGSDGSPSEAGFVAAAQLAYDGLLERGLTPEDVAIYGESLGSGVAIQLAAEKPVRALILVSPMTSIRDVAKSQFPFFPVRALLKDPFLAAELIGRVTAPVLVVHGDRDRIIPIQHGRRVFELANQPKQFHVVKGGGHNDLYDFPIVEVMAAFLRER